MSSMLIRRARFFSASGRDFPARNSKLYNFSSSLSGLLFRGSSSATRFIAASSPMPASTQTTKISSASGMPLRNFVFSARDFYLQTEIRQIKPGDSQNDTYQHGHVGLNNFKDRNAEQKKQHGQQNSQKTFQSPVVWNQLFIINPGPQQIKLYP